MLTRILKTRFGFDAFRPHQEAVCRAVAEGSDALVVMPTGAGKSLCYQLPGLARGGATLVISPLLALIEDQAHRLRQKGMKADRIHSGREREESRETFRSYLKGELEFLFIAPERLAVPGFVEALARRPPTLVAVDEAHCISHWGHDFRPDYRLVGERLRGLGGAPVLALTATATPLVQDDICAQLGLRKARRFIHGFRRENLAIQVLEVPVPERLERTLGTLRGEGRLPAIVYAPTRRKAEELAQGLGAGFRSGAYHAGMTADSRERVQLAFLEGSLEVIVATVAFGMGIDKPNVRTVIHAALPGSLEGYYQEIGRAGRDGLPSQAVMFHSFADRRTHEFFLERDYPEPEALAKVFGGVPAQGSVSRERVRENLKSIEPDVFEKALERLWQYGGLLIDSDENLSRAGEGWRSGYREQRDHRLRQLDLIRSFAEGSGCRMLRVVRHFGDPSDSGAPCGVCDRCAPMPGARTLDELEKTAAALVLAALAGRDGQAAGRLFEEARRADARIPRQGFERVLSALERAGYLEILQEEFEREGKLVRFRKVSQTAKGRSARSDDLAQVEIDGAGLLGAVSRPAGAGKRKRAAKPRHTDAPVTVGTALFEALRSWRREEARKRGVPAFRILTDRALSAICEDPPSSEEALLRIPGIGQKIVRQYGEVLLARIAEPR